MSKFYARNGDEITLEQWCKLVGSLEYKVVKQERTDKNTLVSTVWLGLDHSFSFGSDPDPIPIIFETMVFTNTESWGDEYQQRYVTEEEAREGHERIFNMVRELEEIDGSARQADRTPGGTGSVDQEEQEGHHDLRPSPNQRDDDDAQHTIGPPLTGE